MASFNFEKRTWMITGVIAISLFTSIATGSMLIPILATLVLLFDYDKNSLPKNHNKVGALYVLATLSIIFQYLTAVPHKEIWVAGFILALVGTVLYHVFGIKEFKVG